MHKVLESLWVLGRKDSTVELVAFVIVSKKNKIEGGDSFSCLVDL